ncbi:MAG: alpha/beta fold hydrolase [Chitinophagales bacterium]
MKKLVVFFLAVLVLILAVNFLLLKDAIPLETLKEKYADEYSHFVTLNDLDVHYKMKGEGMPIILIHGTSSSLHTWEAWEDQLSKKHTTYSIDMQGGGLTSPPVDDIYSMQSYIDLLDAFVENKGLDSFYLAGNSLGGHTAWEYAANSIHKDKVKKLILVDPSGFFAEEWERPFVFKLAQNDFLFSTIESIDVSPFVEKSMKEVFYDDDKINDELVQRYKDLMHREGNRKAFFLKVRQIEAGEITDLHKINCPTLIQWGREDIWIPLVLSDIFVENIPNNQLIIYDNAGHIPMEEIPDETVADVIKFLSK